MIPWKCIRLGFVAAAAFFACTSSESERFWQVDADYEVWIADSERPVRSAEQPEPATDSMRVRMSPDSVGRDSLFGRYSRTLDSLGVSIGDGFPEAQEIALLESGDSFSLVFAPNVIDAQVVMSGKLRNGTGSGSWRQLGPASPAGVFTVRKLPM